MAARPGGRRGHRLPARHARAAHHARPRARGRPGGVGRGRGDHVNALVGGVRVGKYSSGGRRHRRAAAAAAEQRSRPEDLARLRRAHRAAASWSRSRRWSRWRSGRRCRRSPAAIASAPSPSSPTSPPATRRARRWPAVAELGRRDAPGLPRGARAAPASTFQRVDGRACSSRCCWGSSSRTWCSPRSSTRSCTRSPC